MSYENMSISDLKKMRETLAKKQIKEYQTRGNTQRSQEMFSDIKKIDHEIAQRAGSLIQG